MRFFISSLLGRVLSILILLAIGGVALIAFGPDPKTDEQKSDQQVEDVSKSLDEDADAISSGVQLHTLRTNLYVTGDWQRYEIKRIMPNDGGYTIQTDLPPGQASIDKVDRLCRQLLGGDPPAIDSPGGLLVFGTGTEPLSGKSCGQ